MDSQEMLREITDHIDLNIARQYDVIYSNYIPPGRTYIVSLGGPYDRPTIIVRPFSDLACHYFDSYNKAIQQERKAAKDHLNRLVVKTRRELGLPLHYRH